jgi:hypothetical protein
MKFAQLAHIYVMTFIGEDTERRQDA